MKVLFIFFLVFVGHVVFSQNSSSGTLTINSYTADCPALTSAQVVRLGNGTIGKVAVCLTTNGLLNTCGGGNNKPAMIFIYDDSNNDGVPDNLLQTWSSGDVTPDCIITAAATGYIWLRFCSFDGCSGTDITGSSITVTWDTYTIPGNNLISGSTNVNLCGTNFAANNISATASTNCDGYVGNTGPPDNLVVAFDNNLDCNTTSSTTTAPYNTNGGDVNFSVENDMYYKFCPKTTGTWTVTLTKGTCYPRAGGDDVTVYGYQYALFQGTESNLGPLISGGTSGMNLTGNTTLNISVTSTVNCYFIMIDGYGGTGCLFNFNLAAPAGVCILPIELISFNATQKDNTVDLNWATATEKNNDYFTVERSVDGLNFTSLEFIDGAGTNNNAQFYSTIDNNPLNGISYYRLKQTDFDKKESYSEIISVDLKNNKDLTFDIVPNPNNENDQTTILLNNLPKSEVVVDVYDVQGVLIYTENKKLESLTFPIPQTFKKGVYYVKITCNDFTETKRLIIK